MARGLLASDPSAWKDVYSGAVRDQERRLEDDPVPKAIVRAISRIDLKDLTNALERMPVRAVGGERRVNVVHVTVNNADHDIHLYAPDVTVSWIETMVDAVRSGQVLGAGAAQ